MKGLISAYGYDVEYKKKVLKVSKSFKSIMLKVMMFWRYFQPNVNEKKLISSS